MNGPSLNVLIVDHDANFRSSLGLELKNAGYRVSMAPGGDRAFAVFPAMDFDVIFADIAMPEGSGPELIKKLRESDRKIPVILMSQAMTPEEAPFEEMGAVAFLQKPFSPQEAIAKIRIIEETQREFSYFLNTRRALTVVSWIGSLGPRHFVLVKNCGDEVVTARSKYVILNLHGFTDYDPAIAGEIVNFQQKVRNIPAWFIICGIHENLRSKMAAKGLVVESEVRKDLQDALQYLMEAGLKV